MVRNGIQDPPSTKYSPDASQTYFTNPPLWARHKALVTVRGERMGLLTHRVIVVVRIRLSEAIHVEELTVGEMTIGVVHFLSLQYRGGICQQIYEFGKSQILKILRFDLMWAYWECKDCFQIILSSFPPLQKIRGKVILTTRL